MVYHERVAWSSLIGTVVSLALYAMLLTGSGAGDIVRADWLPPMLWSIGAGIALSILLSIAWGIIAGRKDPAAASLTDLRDRDISRMGSRVEHAVLILAGLAVIALCALGADLFWVAQTMFGGFAVSSLVGGIARVIAYRRGLV